MDAGRLFGPVVLSFGLNPLKGLRMNLMDPDVTKGSRIKLKPTSATQMFSFDVFERLSSLVDRQQMTQNSICVH